MKKPGLATRDYVNIGVVSVLVITSVLLIIFAFMLGWNGFMSPAFRLPQINFVQSLAAWVFLNALLTPYYATRQVASK